MLVPRRRRWTSIKPALVQPFVFAWHAQLCAKIRPPSVTEVYWETNSPTKYDSIQVVHVTKTSLLCETH